MKRIVLFLLVTVYVLPMLSKEHTITVYNDDLALVRTVEELAIPKGVSIISMEDVAAKIDPASVHFKSLTSASGLAILEQNFEYDLADAQVILSKYLDETIRLMTEEGEVYSGKLLNHSNDSVVLQLKDGSIQIIQKKWVLQFDFPELPKGLRSKPTLVWLAKNNGPETQNTELSYITKGMSWQADYVAVTNEEDTKLDLSAWVTLENKAGVTFENAGLKLMAGEVNRVSGKQRRYARKEMEFMTAQAADARFEEKSFFEYHLYTLNRKTTLKNNQTKQVTLFPSAETGVLKKYVYHGTRNQDDVAVYLELKNEEKSGLGLPLPKGIIRVYKEDSDGSLVFIGEDQLDHTPVDEEIDIKIGNAFDIKGERTQLSEKRLSDRARETEVEVIIRNHKKSSVPVQIQEYLYGDWQVLSATHQYEKENATTLLFDVNVPAKGEVKVVYKALIKW